SGPPETPITMPRLDLAEQLRLDAIARAGEIRDEARALLRQALEEALAPIHYELLEVKRRVTELEKKPSPPPPPPAPAAPVALAPQPAPPPPRVAVDPFAMAPATAAPPAPNVAAPARVVAPPPSSSRVGSIGDLTQFDGSRR